MEYALRAGKEEIVRVSRKDEYEGSGFTLRANWLTPSRCVGVRFCVILIGDCRPTDPVTGTMTFARDITMKAI